MSSVFAKLSAIQTELKAPKNLFNKFGNYSYRNAEGILEAVKPYLKEQGCSLIINDDIVTIGNRFYVKATATLIDCETGDVVSTSALAREPEDKKGMDSSQITGASSTYARKYALNGLFVLDDTKDEDSEELKVEKEKKAEKENPKAEPKAVNPNDKIPETIVTAFEHRCGSDSTLRNFIFQGYKINSWAELTNIQAATLNANWDDAVARSRKQRDKKMKIEGVAMPVEVEE